MAHSVTYLVSSSFQKTFVDSGLIYTGLPVALGHFHQYAPQVEIKQKLLKCHQQLPIASMIQLSLLTWL